MVGTYQVIEHPGSATMRGSSNINVLDVLPIGPYSDWTFLGI